MLNSNISKLLIANRGEIACRIIRTAHQMGIQCVAVYSSEDKNAQHVKLADEAWYLGEAPATESYLKTDLIIEVAKSSGANAIHPGYGFLSENADFAQQCESSNILFIGPPAAAINAMGSKDEAKNIMSEAGVPLVPGYHGKDQSEEHLKKQADKIGYPLLIKANAGGGGKGMRIVKQANDFLTSLKACKRESLASFGDDSVLLEKYLTQPRHIEIQIFSDNHGNDLYLFERDCSVQRRHQKVIEEAPAPGITQETREQMGLVATTAAKAIGYRGAGTVEFLYDQDGSFYFMEMNTRLQVEHPVTEKITGLDLVEWQIIVANNQSLPLKQSDLKINGHAFEARIYAEDPNNDFLPTSGKISHLKLPELNQHIRIDSGVVSGDNISVYYDPMIAKLIVWDTNRNAALSRLKGALAKFYIAGIENNIHFLHQLASNDAFANAELNTQFLTKHGEELTLKNDYVDDPILVAAALYIMLKQAQTTLIDKNDPYSPWQETTGWRLNEDNFHTIEFSHTKSQQSTNYSIIAHFSDKENSFLFEVSSKEYLTSGYLSNGQLHMTLDGHQIVIDIAEDDNQLVLFKNADSWTFKVKENKAAALDANSNNNLQAPMPGTIIDVLVEPGDLVEKGQAIIVMEAMKMEHTIKAHKNILINDVLYQVGDLVEDSAELIIFEEQAK